MNEPNGVLTLARILHRIYGVAETERALAEVYQLTEAQICCIMQQLAANNN